MLKSQKYHLKAFLLIVSVCISVLIIGCGSAPKGKGPIFANAQPNEGKAIVCHYRLEKSMGNGMYYYLYMNDEFVTFIGNGGYYLQELMPGEYEYSALMQVTGVGPLIYTYAYANDSNQKAKAKHALNLTVESNSSYFYRWTFRSEMFEQVEEDVALKELQGMKQFVLDE